MLVAAEVGMLTVEHGNEVDDASLQLLLSKGCICALKSGVVSWSGY